MLYTNSELNKVKEILESDKACELIDSLDNLIGDMDLPSVSDMVDYAMAEYRKKSMYIIKARIHEEGEIKEGYAIEIENEDDGYDVAYFCRLDDCGGLPFSLIANLSNLAEMGYKLKGSKNEVVDILV